MAESELDLRLTRAADTIRSALAPSHPIVESLNLLGVGNHTVVSDRFRTTDVLPVLERLAVLLESLAECVTTDPDAANGSVGDEFMAELVSLRVDV